jgi:hypothetical protein
VLDQSTTGFDPNRPLIILDTGGRLMKLTDACQVSIAAATGLASMFDPVRLYDL